MRGPLLEGDPSRDNMNDFTWGVHSLEGTSPLTGADPHVIAWITSRMWGDPREQISYLLWEGILRNRSPVGSGRGPQVVDILLDQGGDPQWADPLLLQGGKPQAADHLLAQVENSQAVEPLLAQGGDPRSGSFRGSGRGSTGNGSPIGSGRGPLGNRSPIVKLIDR